MQLPCHDMHMYPASFVPYSILLSQGWVRQWSLCDIQKSTEPKARSMTEAKSIPASRFPVQGLVRCQTTNLETRQTSAMWPSRGRCEISSPNLKGSFWGQKRGYKPRLGSLFRDFLNHFNLLSWSDLAPSFSLPPRPLSAIFHPKKVSSYHITTWQPTVPTPGACWNVPNRDGRFICPTTTTRKGGSSTLERW